MGKTGQIFAEDAGKLMLPGSRIRWEVHMHAIGEEYKGYYYVLLWDKRGARLTHAPEDGQWQLSKAYQGSDQLASVDLHPAGLAGNEVDEVQPNVHAVGRA